MFVITSRRKFIKDLAADGDLIRISNPRAYAPNQTYKDFTCDFDKADDEARIGAPA